MSLTLGLTGMDQATETALKATFAVASARLGGRWQLIGESDAAHVLVDMDSMYGPMSWLRLHAAGKRVIGLTTAPRTQTDFRLGRPFDTDALTELLRAIAVASGIELDAAQPDPSPAPSPESPADEAGDESAAQQVPTEVDAAPDARDDIQGAASPSPAEPVSDAAEAIVAPEMTPAPEPQDTLDDETASGPPASDPLPTADARLGEDALTDDVPADPPPAPEPIERERTLIDWLAPGAAARRVRYRRDSGPTLLIDTSAGTYHGPGTLKPLAGYFIGRVDETQLEPVADDAWTRESASAGAAQPLARLLWLHGLVTGGGRLLPGSDPDGRYRLVKWPQTEREYPRHFRIATAMMKGPATLAEITEASAMSLEDVSDFVNANLATGFAEFVPEPQPEPAEAPRPTGLLGRLRGR